MNLHFEYKEQYSVSSFTSLWWQREAQYLISVHVRRLEVTSKKKAKSRSRLLSRSHKKYESKLVYYFPSEFELRKRKTMKTKIRKDGTMELCILKGSVYRTSDHCSDWRGEEGRLWVEVIR
jgi:hypothetical protein